MRSSGRSPLDEEAITLAAQRGALASALLKFDEGTNQPAPVVGIAPERVDHLMGDPNATRWQLGAVVGWGALALVALSGLFALSWQIEAAAEVPLLVAAGCMTLMVGGPIGVAIGAVLLSRRALRVRRELTG
jgi:hypothetical protein